MHMYNVNAQVLYRRIHGLDVGVGRESMVTNLSQDAEDRLVANVQDGSYQLS